MLSSIRKNKEGFTIIEVLIVLAIAGLIMLIVFLAVPALQRNSRNTQRRNDISNIGSSINEHISNNAGSLPANCFEATQNTNLGFYTKPTSTSACNSITMGPGSTAGNLSANTGEAAARIVTGARCGTGGAATASGATSRQVVILFAVETSGSPAPQCQEI